MKKHDDLIPALENAPKLIADYFPDSKLHLKVFQDIETPKWVCLFLDIENKKLSFEQQNLLLDSLWDVWIPKYNSPFLNVHLWY